jgi:hypothetical protein
VDTAVFKKAPDGRAIPSADANWEAYQSGGDMNRFIVDPTGIIVYGQLINVVGEEEEEWYLRRLQEKYAKGAK